MKIRETHPDSSASERGLSAVRARAGNNRLLGIGVGTCSRRNYELTLSIAREITTIHPHVVHLYIASACGVVVVAKIEESVYDG